MRSLGMSPVLPAFAGFVPGALAKLYPHASITKLPNWGHFTNAFCCVHLLDPLDPLFVEIGSTFVKVSPLTHCAWEDALVLNSLETCT